jgi:hypothetical protein
MFITHTKEGNAARGQQRCLLATRSSGPDQDIGAQDFAPQGFAAQGFAPQGFAEHGLGPQPCGAQPLAAQARIAGFAVRAWRFAFALLRLAYPPVRALHPARGAQVFE